MESKRSPLPRFDEPRWDRRRQCRDASWPWPGWDDKSAMSKMKLNGIVDSLHGKFGNVVFRNWEGDVVMSRLPDRSSVVPTEGQTAHQQRFREAAAYAKSVFADPAAKAYYEAASENRHKPAFALAVGDFLKAPVVGAIDLTGYAGKSGGKIAIVATDDVGVAGVSVVIRNTVDSTVIEQGVALEEAGKWRYTATADAPAGASIVVEVTASDRPGNATVKTEAKP